jgi:hypothetical protein
MTTAEFINYNSYVRAQWIKASGFKLARRGSLQDQDLWSIDVLDGYK